MDGKALSKPAAINQNSDFRRIYARGRSYPSSALVTYVMKNRRDAVRYGITAGKKIGNAVERNRSRRVIRAAFFELFPSIQEGCDIVFVARSKTKYLKSHQVKKAMWKQLSDAGVIKE